MRERIDLNSAEASPLCSLCAPKSLNQGSSLTMYVCVKSHLGRLITLRNGAVSDRQLEFISHEDIFELGDWGQARGQGSYKLSSKHCRRRNACLGTRLGYQCMGPELAELDQLQVWSQTVSITDIFIIVLHAACGRAA